MVLGKASGKVLIDWISVNVDVFLKRSIDSFACMACPISCSLALSMANTASFTIGMNVIEDKKSINPVRAHTSNDNQIMNS